MVAWVPVCSDVLATVAVLQTIKSKRRRIKGIPSADGQWPVLGHMRLIKVRPESALHDIALSL